MADAILATCVVCGKAFNGHKHKSNKFCSIDCYRVAQRSGAYKVGHKPTTFRAACSHCGLTVIGSPSKKRNGEKSDASFCNRDCYDAYRSAVIAGRKKACALCGVQFNPHSSKSKYCSESCWKSDKKASPKHCVNCNCFFTPVKMMSTGKYISHNYGKTCSAYCENQWIRNNPERKRKIGNAFRGINHPNWQGGKSQLNNVSNRGPNWKKQRELALKRDGRKCVDCGMTESESIETYGQSLDVDHVVPYHNFGNYKKANALSNLQSRCKSCHKKEEHKRGMVQMVLPLQDSIKRQHKGRRAMSNATLTEGHVKAIRQRHCNGQDLRSIWADFGQVGINAIRDVIKGKTWKNVL